MGQGSRKTHPNVHPPPPHCDSSAPPMPSPFLKRKQGTVHRAVGIFLSVMLFFGILFCIKILLFISLCISLVPQHQACKESLMNSSMLQNLQ